VVIDDVNNNGRPMLQATRCNQRASLLGLKVKQSARQACSACRAPVAIVP